MALFLFSHLELAGLMSDGDDALHRIDTHEKVCSERHGYIMESLKDLRAEDSELKAELKATKGTLRQELENVEIGLRKEMRSADNATRVDVKANTEAIAGIKIQIAYFLGAAAVGSFLGGGLFQLLSGALTK